MIDFRSMRIIIHNYIWLPFIVLNFHLKKLPLADFLRFTTGILCSLLLRVFGFGTGMDLFCTFIASLSELVLTSNLKENCHLKKINGNLLIIEHFDLNY